MAARRFKLFAIILTCAVLLQSETLIAAPVTVRHTEGLIHGFLVLSTTRGEPVALGDLTQVSHGDRVTTPSSSDSRTAQSTMRPPFSRSAVVSDF
jgi:hypothetical protein